MTSGRPERRPAAAGRASGAELEDLLRRLELLELIARRNAAGPLAGDYLTSILGRGLLFREPRRYVEGEPARRIDWNITARLGEPYVKVHEEERQREVMLAVDVSPSMHVGFRERTKLELAVELAATLAVSAVTAGDRVGHVLFADRVLASSRPRGGRAQLFAVLRSLLDHAAPWRRPVAVSDPRLAVHAIQRHRGRRFVVFLISDFVDHDLPEDLKYVQARHDVTLLHVYDPVEHAATEDVLFLGRAPEGDGKTPPVRLSPGDTGSLEEVQRFLADQCGRQRIGFASLSTADSVRSSLERLFHQRRRRRVVR